MITANLGAALNLMPRRYDYDAGDITAIEYDEDEPNPEL